MPLVRLKPTDNGKQWGDIAEPSYVLWKASAHTELNALTEELKAYFNDSKVEIMGLVTVLKRDHHAVIVQKGCDIIIAFLENGEAEWNRNGWYLGKSAPYKRKVDGDLVHSYYLAVWEGMREHARADLTHAIGKILQEGKAVRKILVCGHSLVGGVSSLAFTDILYFIRNDFGSKSGTWGNGDSLNDENLPSVLQHFTFAGFAAADIGYHTKLNNTCEKYQIQAWDFVHHKDQTNQAHIPWFNTWRGHCYELPAEIVDHFASEFGPQCHGIEGYAQVAEWMYRCGGGDMVRSKYSY
ncbi:hypothetical protein BLS_005674 [Venturia inaequalis]|uniref:Fungal lipase-type domain-containing protein n=1 Tax=Venturia inaequalis TaxID=5025 RepID=A0A8H3UFM7_VENIN|nr:hypothetical protein BLS_005674 [Venturia inaequalis]